MLLTQISLTLFHYSSLSSIASGRSSRLQPVSVQSCCVLVGHPTLACLCDGAHRRTSLMSSALLLQQYPACLVHLILMVFEMGGRWPYSCCFMGCCFQNLFNIAHSILVQFLSYFSSIHLVCIHVVELTRMLLGKKLGIITESQIKFANYKYAGELCEDVACCFE